MISVTSSGNRRVLGAATAALVVACAAGALAPAASAAAAAPRATAATAPAAPDQHRGVGYLVAPARLTGGKYYESFPGYADFGLTLDGAFALAATGGDDAALRKITAFFADRGKDASARTADDWTSVGTEYAAGGSIAKEALLAEVTGADPHAFGGHDLIAALDRTVCAAATGDNSCAAPGGYRYSPSVFAQSLGIIAQLRSGDTANAAAPVAYLEGLQHADGSWPSLIPASKDSDVDSTAMAVMALALAPGDTASAAVAKGVAWIAARQEKDGGFPGAAGDSTNSAALAVQALTLDKERYAGPITDALAFLAARQNSDGGFRVAASGPAGSDVRAATQAVGGATGIPFGTLTHRLTGTGGGTPSASPTTTASATPTPTAPATTTGRPTASPSGDPTPTISTIGGDPGDGAAGGLPGAGAVTGGGGQLAATGADVRGTGLAAAALLAAGGAAVALTRRRPAPGRRR